MKAKVITIGNSKGIRIPKVLLDDWQDDQEVTLEKKGGKIIISPVSSSRSDWTEQILRVNEEFPEYTSKSEDWIENKFDQEEWTW